jgi:hypothetical protein
MSPRTLVCVALLLLLAGMLSGAEARHSRRPQHAVRLQPPKLANHHAAPKIRRADSAVQQPSWGNPVPNPAAVVLAPGGLAKFTVLTPQLIRMQYDPNGNFSGLDVQTYVVLNRNLPVPQFTQQVQGSVLIISTGQVLLRYDSSDRTSFNHANLQVTVMNVDGKGNQSVWSAAPGADQVGNLLGTVRTLDGSDGFNKPLDCDINFDGDSHCSWAVIGSSGYAVVDDTGAPAFDTPQPDTWTWLRSRPQPPVNEAECTVLPQDARRQCGFNGIASDECGRRGCCFNSSSGQCFYSASNSQDLYFFGHGLNYKQA